MREMKDSKTKAIGEMPITWNDSRLKYEVVLNGRIGFRGYTQNDLVDEGEGAITLSPSNLCDGKMNYERCSYISWFKYDESPEIKVQNGNILMVKTGSSYGKNAIVEDLPLEATINPQLLIIKPIRCNNKFLFYVLQTSILVHQIENAVVGGTIPTVAQEKINNFYIPLPDIDIQEKIVGFLDTKCNEIDALTADIQTQIETLEQYKKSVITEAVTKGLNPDVEMKDSGIEWIGNISKECKVVRMKHNTYMKGRIGWQGLKSQDFIDDGPYCITSTDFQNGKVVWERCYHVSEERYAMDPYIQVKKGDILISKDGTIGKLAIIDELPYKACLNSHLLIIRPPKEYLMKYIYYVLSSDLFVHYYSLEGSGSTMQSLSQEKLGEFSFPIWNIEKQKEIIAFLDKTIPVIDSVIQDKNEQLEILADYKKSLIYEYVTGKKEVM